MDAKLKYKLNPGRRKQIRGSVVISPRHGAFLLLLSCLSGRVTRSFLRQPPPFHTRLLTVLELTEEGRLAGRVAPGIGLPLPPSCVCKHESPPHSALLRDFCGHGSQVQGKQALHRLNNLRRPKHCVMYFTHAPFCPLDPNKQSWGKLKSRPGK